MTAQRVSVLTIDFPDPYLLSYDNDHFDTLNESFSFQYRVSPESITTLSTKGLSSGTDPYGILYLPDLLSDACKDAESTFVPVNATRKQNLPPGKSYALLAIAPWSSPQCMTEYFTSARRSATKAMLVFQPGDSEKRPPMLNDPSWNLEDGGAWQSANTFPTYALTSMVGSIFMQQLALYSGNVSSVPHWEEFEGAYNTSDYIRLWATIATDSGNQLPSLWVFLVIAMAVLLVAVSATSIAMHIVQRRRRRALRERVINGEIDLEALGVKRLTVSRQVLDKMPVNTYTTNAPIVSSKETPPPVLFSPSELGIGSEDHKATHSITPSSFYAPSANGLSAAWSQPTCPICLDDYESEKTLVRELPCRHIFHPDCIDTFLLRNSSLCPVCKQSALPPGECPVHITNIMVRRERHINRMNARGAAGQQDATQPAVATGPLASLSRIPALVGSFASKLGSRFIRRSAVAPPEGTHPTPPDIEMVNANATQQATPAPVSTADPTIPDTVTTATPATATPATATPATAATPAATATATATATASSPITPAPEPAPIPDCDSVTDRRELARQRAVAMLGPEHISASADESDPPLRPRWRRTLDKIFPVS